MIVRLVTAAILLLSSFVSYYLLSGKAEEYERDFNQLRSAINVEESKLNKIIKQKEDFKESIRLWQRLSDNTKRREGLKIDRGQEILTQLQEEFYLNSFSSEFTLPEELADIYKTDTTVVVSSNVSIKFQSITDELALSFIDTLTRELPGYTKLQNLSLKAMGDTQGVLSTEDLQKISQGEFPSLIDVNLVFKWQDLKAITTTPPTQATPEEGGING